MFNNEILADVHFKVEFMAMKELVINPIYHMQALPKELKEFTLLQFNVYNDTFHV